VPSRVARFPKLLKDIKEFLEGIEEEKKIGVMPIIIQCIIICFLGVSSNSEGCIF